MTDDEPDIESYDPERDAEYWPGEWVPRDAIEPNDWNPNELDQEEFERLVTSIEDNGWTMPIVVHAEENYIIDGEHRWVAAEHLPDDPDLTPEGIPADHVPVYGITVSESQAKLATVQHNRVRGEVRVDRLQEYLRGLDDRGVLPEVQDRIGVQDDTIEELLGEIATPDLPDETMPWEEETEPDVLDEEDDDTDDDGADTDSEPEQPIPELHEDRTVALRGDVDEEVLENAESHNTVLSESEYEQVCEALGEEMRAQSLVNLARYVDDRDAYEKLVEFEA